MSGQATSAECVVIGAGPAGLGVSAMLGRRGVDTLILEAADTVAPSWHARYDGFRLNTSSWFSYLPGRRLPRSAGRWPSREALVAYYTDYARRHELKVRLGATVERVERRGEGWSLRTVEEAIDARFVVLATGKYRTPAIPHWRGRDTFAGQLMHSADYRNPAPFLGRDVLVVGPGASGFEIATQIARASGKRVPLSIRTPPHLIHRDVGPFPSDLFAVLGRRLPVRAVDWAGERIRRLTIGDLTDLGLQPPPDGIYSRLRRTGMIPTADGPYIEALKTGSVQIVAAVEHFDGPAVVLSDGRHLEPDVVIAATGYRRDLEPLVGHLGVLDADGHPLADRGRTHPRAPGLYFIGFSEPLSGNLRQLRLDARQIARSIAHRRG